MKNVSIFVFRDNMATYLNEVVKTQTPIVIHKYNKPIAMITPVNEDERLKEIRELAGFMGNDGEDGVAYENRVRRNKREREHVKKLLKGQG